ncbi:LacI family DNA-binding transcriptional regulator [Planctomycetota bacterium]|nr:LacI family DNA-binding transcriptional regulator [Planctomycetota bacterium]
MSRNSTISLAVVAKLSGVSTSTVSRILNNRSDGFSVRDETRKRVLKVAKDLNYRTDPIARSSRAKHTNLIAVLGMQDFGTAIRGSTEEALNKFMQITYASGYELCMNVISPEQSIYELPRWRVDGAIVVDCSDNNHLKSLDESGVPYVTINGPAGINGSSVSVDDMLGTKEALLHLMALGHKRIAYAIPDQYDWHRSLESRHAAYIRTLKEVNIEPLTPIIPEPEPPIEAVRKMVTEQGATAILVYHHMMAVKIIRALHTLGYHVPRDISLICFNDLFPCEDMVPSLTAMSLPSNQMGVKAAEIILKQLRNPDTAEPQQIILSERLVIRESTAPAPLIES